MAPYIDAWFALSLVIIGLSHAAQPRLWADFFNAMKRTGFAPLIIGMYTLPTGLVILLGHNIWAWDWPVFVTIAGWGMTIKATIYLHLPGGPQPDDRQRRPVAEGVQRLPRRRGRDERPRRRAHLACVPASPGLGAGGSWASCNASARPAHGLRPRGVNPSVRPAASPNRHSMPVRMSSASRCGASTSRV